MLSLLLLETLPAQNVASYEGNVTLATHKTNYPAAVFVNIEQCVTDRVVRSAALSKGVKL